MGCHLIDPPYRVLGLGYPKEVEAHVGQVFTQDWIPEHLPESCPISSQVKMTFPAVDDKGEVELYWYDGGMQPFRPDLIPEDHPIGDRNGANGAMMIGTEGIISCGTYGRDPVLHTSSGEVRRMPEGHGGDRILHDQPEWGHQLLWTRACKAGYGSREHAALTSAFDYSGPLTETVLMGNLAIRSHALLREDEQGDREHYGRKKLQWDGSKMEITNLKEANQYVGRAYRPGWKYI